MPLNDSPQCRDILSHIFPGIEIESNLKPSGQRLVYFCSFPGQTDVETQQEWSDWGPVVLKVSEDVHPWVIARLKKECDLLKSLSSQYFPRSLYSGVFAGDPITDEKFHHPLFITIEARIDGLPLGDCKVQFATECSCVQLLGTLIEGLRLLWDHPQRIVHRDLKPENILIRPDGAPVIIDLGIVREQGSAGLTASHWSMGPCTPMYGSPEQLRNQKQFITYKADFFSLGVIAYELLSGANPFVQHAHELLEVVVSRVLTHTPPTLAKLGRASPKLSALIERLMAKEPYLRPRTVADLARELESVRGAI